MMNRVKRIVNGELVKLKNHSNKRDNSIWLFGEWFGKRCCDNCMYLANHVADAHPEISIFWASEKDADLSDLDSRVKRLVFGTEEAADIYKKAGVVFMNQDFRDFSKEGYNYFSGALTINLWHGVMWKHIGHDGSENKGIYKAYAKVLDALYGAEAYMAVSEDYARICGTAFGAGPEQIIRAGAPRNSVFYSPEKVRAARERVLRVLSEETGLEHGADTKIITYMPTFRDKAENAFSFEDLPEDDKLIRWLEENNAVILQKAHFVTQQRNELQGGNSQKRVYPFNDVAAQILLAATDLLVTDYSSCFFDYLLLDRPIVHYLYDYDYYLNHDRGMYYKKEEVVCGDVAENKEELSEMIIRNIEDPAKDHDLRVLRKEQYMTYETPDSCEVIVQEVKKRLNIE